MVSDSVALRGAITIIVNEMNTRQILTSAVVLSLAFTMASGQTRSYTADISLTDTSVIEGQLDLGGTDGKGGSITVNNRYIVRDGRPFIPVFGEFHYGRYDRSQWEQEIMKMKAGGISVISTYVFWNLHEPEEGRFVWSGNLDLRHFVELCAKYGIYVIVRVGPFDHGEMRNGGLPDWLYGRPIEVRSNDREYLKYAGRLYEEIGAQLKGLFYKDNGPIIGIQIENEYQHSAAPWGFTYDGAPRELTAARRDVGITQIQVGVNDKGNSNSAIGQSHMAELKRLAVNAGLTAPIYTATGWGYATIVEGGSIPVMSCYAYPSWEPAQKKTEFFLYKDICSNPDYAPVSYDTSKYPSMAAELGTGMMPSWARRTYVPQESMLPMMIRTVGSGSNGLGYYMYHGGTTPSEGNYFYTEGFGLSLKSYDYQAPLGEFGRPEKSFRTLKLINYFLGSYGTLLAPMKTNLPDQLPSSPEDLETLRWAVRSNGREGFVFMHNFQDHMKAADIAGSRLVIKTQEGSVSIPQTGAITLKAGESAILPFGIAFNGVKFRYATVQPLCRFTKSGKEYNVFFSIDGISPEILLEGRHSVRGGQVKASVINGSTLLRLPQGTGASFTIDDKPFLILTRKDAENAYLAGDKLFIFDGIISEENGLSLLTTNRENTLTVYPAAKTLTTSMGKVESMPFKDKSMSKWKITLPDADPRISLVRNDDRHFTLDGSHTDWSGINEIWIRFNYQGDRALCMMGGKLQTDDLYNSRPWTVGLKRYAPSLKEEPMYFYFIPMQKDAEYLKYLNEVPDFGEGKEYLKIETPTVEVERKITLSAN